MSERVKVNVKVSSEVNTILHDLFNQIQYEFCEQYEEEIKGLNNQLDFIKDQNKYIDKLEKMVKERNSIIKEVKEYLPKLRVSSSYELDDKIDNLEAILEKVGDSNEC